MYFRQTSFELTTSYRKENWYGVKSLFFFSSKYKGSLLWVLSRSVIQDQWDYGSSEEPMNPLWTQIHRLLSVLSFFYHASFYSWSAGTMRARCESERGARDEKKKSIFPAQATPRCVFSACVSWSLRTQEKQIACGLATWAPAMHHDPSNFGSPIQMLITTKKRTLNSRGAYWPRILNVVSSNWT